MISALRRIARAERGSEAIEAAIGVPAFVLFIGMIIVAGRIAATHAAVSAAAEDGARSASIARTQAAAQTDGAAAAAASLTNQNITCQSMSISVDARQFALPVGMPAQVTTTVTCVVPLADLAVPGMPGTRTVTETMSSPVDTYRER